MENILVDTGAMFDNVAYQSVEVWEECSHDRFRTVQTQIPKCTDS